MVVKNFQLLVVLSLVFTPGVLCPAANNIIVAHSVALVDEAGNTVSIDSYNSNLRLVFFGYTHCPDICPLTMYNLAAALKALGPDAEKIKVLFISVDPKRDTPAVLANYTGAFHPSIIGLTGSYENLVELTTGFRTTFGYTLVEHGKDKSLSSEEYEKMSADAPYIPFHSSYLYLLDKDGQLLDIIGYGSTAVEIEARLREFTGYD